MGSLSTGATVCYDGCVGTIIASAFPPARRIGGELRLLGEPTITILFADGTAPPREVTLAQSSWDQVEIIEPDAQ
jgi:hypothetical protein